MNSSKLLGVLANGKERAVSRSQIGQCYRPGFRPGRGGDNLENFGIDKFLMAIGELDSPYLRLFALSMVAVVLTSGCAVPTGTGDSTPPDPGMTLYPIPDRLSSPAAVPVELPPTAVDLTATSTAAVLTGAGGGRPPLCDPLLAPFIPGEQASKNSEGAWIDSQGNPLIGADVDGILFAMSGLAGDKFELHVQTAGFGEEFRWWVQSLNGNGWPGWNGSNQDQFLDRPDSLPDGAGLKINLLPDPVIAGEIKLGISGGEVTAAAVRDGFAVKCFNPVTNEWFVPDSSGPAAAETTRPPETAGIGLGIDRDLGAELTGQAELVEAKTPEQDSLTSIPVTPTTPPPTEKPTAAATAKPTEAQPLPTAVAPPSATPEAQPPEAAAGPCLQDNINSGRYGDWQPFIFPGTEACLSLVRLPQFEGNNEGNNIVLVEVGIKGDKLEVWGDGSKTAIEIFDENLRAGKYGPLAPSWFQYERVAGGESLPNILFVWMPRE